MVLLPRGIQDAGMTSGDQDYDIASDGMVTVVGEESRLGICCTGKCGVESSLIWGSGCWPRLW